MKTIATLTVLAGSMFLGGADQAVAQSYYYSPPSYRRVVIQRPTVVRSTPVVTYGGFSHIDDLAIELEQQSRDILWEMHFHYSRNAGYAATYAEAFDVFRMAKLIHHNEHLGNRAEIARIVGELDPLFHHIEDDIAGWRSSHRHGIGGTSLFQKMEALEETLHHLMEDVGLAGSTNDPPMPPSRNSNPPLPSGPALRLP